MMSINPDRWRFCENQITLKRIIFDAETHVNDNCEIICLNEWKELIFLLTSN